MNVNFIKIREPYIQRRGKKKMQFLHKRTPSI